MFKVAVIGAGRIGRLHARNVAAHPALRLSHVVDPSEGAAEAVVAQSGGAVADLDAVLADPQVAGAVVCSPTDAHLDQTLRLLAAGKRVLCEKPLDLDLARARGAAAALGDGRERLTLGFNRRFDPHFAVLRRRLVDGEIGALETLHIVSHDPAPPPASYVRTSGGLFKDMAIHDFDMARWLLGEEPVEIYAAASCLVDPAIGLEGDVDTAKTVLRTGSGKLCVISNSRRSGYGYDQRIEAFGSKGALRVDNVLESAVSTWGSAGAAADAFQNFFLDRYAQAYVNEVEQFARMLAGGEGPAVGYDDAVAALALAEAAGESVRRKAVVALSLASATV